MVSLQELSRIAEIEFTDIVDTTEFIGIKLRIMLTKGVLSIYGCPENF